MSIAQEIYDRNIKRRSLIDRAEYAAKEARKHEHELTQSRLFYSYRFSDGSGLKFAKNNDRCFFGVI